MKKVVLSIGNSIELQGISDLVSNIEEKLDSGQYCFEGFVSVFTNEVSAKYHSILKGLVDHLANDLGMLLKVYFHRKEVSSGTLDIVKACEQFFFLEKATVGKSNNRIDLSPETKHLEEKLTDRSPVEKIRELRFFNFKESVVNQRGLYFGLPRTTLEEDYEVAKDNMSGFDVFGDLDAFSEMINFENLMSDQSNTLQKKTA